ncbi:MAG: hypothetical protein ACK452_07980, partial [Bacteroidota bacterium]
PKYSTSTSPNCYISAGSLVLNANPFTYGAANGFTVTITFNPGYNGACASASFSIKDINSDESNGTFLDVVLISAIDANNTAVPPANISVTVPTNTNVSTTGNSKKIVGHNSSSESYTYNSSGPPYSSFFSSSCNSTNVVVTPPFNTPLKTVTIIFRPANGGTVSSSCSTCAYYNLTGPTRPANQYVSISNIVLNNTASCSVSPLPIELGKFTASRISNKVNLKWNTLTEINNDYFTIERSIDGIKYEELSKIKGAGNSYSELQYETMDENPFTGITYYRLKQTDYNHDFNYFEPIIVEVEKSDISIYNIVYD